MARSNARMEMSILVLPIGAISNVTKRIIWTNALPTRTNGIPVGNGISNKIIVVGVLRIWALTIVDGIIKVPLI